MLYTGAKTSAAVQTQINALRDAARAGGASQAYNEVLTLPAGRYTYDAAGVELPRTYANGTGTVYLEGEGGPGTVVWVPAFGLVWPARPAGAFGTDEFKQGVIRWALADGTFDRVLAGGVRNMTIRMPVDSKAAGVQWLTTIDDSSGSGFQKVSGVKIERVRVECYNDNEQCGFELRGVCHNVVLHDCEVDTGIRTAFAVDTIGIVSDDGPTAGTYGGDSGLDNGGMYSCRVVGFTVQNISGGPCALVRGRWQFAVWLDVNAGNGTTGTPLIDLVRSGGVDLTGFCSEGRAESPAWRLRQTRGSRFRSFTLGTPDPGINNEPYGNGIELDNCNDNVIESWVVWPGKTEWGPGRARPVRRVVVGANCMGNRIEMPIGDDGFSNDGGEPASVVQDLSAVGANDVTLRNVRVDTRFDYAKVSREAAEALAAAEQASEDAAEVLAQIGPDPRPVQIKYTRSFFTITRVP